jgi:antiviral helicase SLH1
MSLTSPDKQKFEQIKVRESEVKELELLMANIPCDVRVS